MLNTTNKQPINVGILEISSQNRAILEYFFSEAGKSYFKEVSPEKASAYIIDYDSFGAKESWESTFAETSKPGIIISIKEVDLPSTIWLPKPLTVKALTEAGKSIREMMIDNEAPKVAAVVDEPIIEVEVEAKEEVVVVDMIDSQEEIKKEESPEENYIEEDNNEGSIDLIDDLLVDEVADNTLIENFEETEATEAIVEEKNETVEEQSLLSEEIIMEEVKKPLVIEMPKEAELPLTETNASASSTNFAVSADFVELDTSLESSDESLDETVSETANDQNTINLVTPIDEPEIAKSNSDSEVDSLLKSLISGGKSTKKSSNVLTDVTESDSELPSLDFELETELPTETDNTDSKLVETISLEDDNTSIKLEALEEAHSSEEVSEDLETTLNQLDTTEKVDDTINQILQSDTNADNKPKKKSAEEELQSLLEEIRQEADGTAPASNSKGSSQRAQKYTPTSAEERWKLTCGNYKDDVKLQKLCLYNPNDHVLSLLLENIKAAKTSNEILRIKFKGIITVIDPESDLIYCDQDIFTEFYANICHEKIDKSKVKIHQLDTSEKRLYSKKMKEENELTHSTEAFIWTTSLLTSKGRLPKNTKINGKVGLSSWPDLTRLESIPNMMQIAALLNKDEWSLSEIINKSGIAQKHVIAFYNAALALDMIENNVTAKSATLDLKSAKKNNNRSFFSKLLNKITA